MFGIADKIAKRVRAHGKGAWICTPRDFLDLGSRAAVDQALTRLAKAGQLRRGRPWLIRFIADSAGVEPPGPGQSRSSIAKVARRDNLRYARRILAANRVGLTNAVPARRTT